MDLLEDNDGSGLRAAHDFQFIIFLFFLFVFIFGNAFHFKITVATLVVCLHVALAVALGTRQGDSWQEHLLEVGVDFEHEEVVEVGDKTSVVGVLVGGEVALQLDGLGYESVHHLLQRNRVCYYLVILVSRHFTSLKFTPCIFKRCSEQIVRYLKIWNRIPIDGLPHFETQFRYWACTFYWRY